MYNRNLGFLFDDYRPFRILWKLLTDFVADRIEEYVRCTTIRGVATPLMLYKFKTYLLTYTSIPLFDTTMFLIWTSTQNDTVSVFFPFLYSSAAALRSNCASKPYQQMLKTCHFDQWCQYFPICWRSCLHHHAPRPCGDDYVTNQRNKALIYAMSSNERR